MKLYNKSQIGVHHAERTGTSKIHGILCSEFAHAVTLEVNGVKVIMSSVEISEMVFERVVETQ